jgi:hypothetical protein
MPIQSPGGKARKPLKIRGFEAVKRAFLPTRFGEEPEIGHSSLNTTGGIAMGKPFWA